MSELKAGSTQAFAPFLFTEAGRKERVLKHLPEIDSLYRAHAQKNRFPGYAYGLVMEGEWLHGSCGGFLELESQKAVNLRSKFRMASMTKSLTALAVLKLRDEEKLDLDEPAEVYFPSLKNCKLTNDSPRITLRDLLLHSAGFPTDDPWADRKLAESVKDLADFVAGGVYFSNPAQATYEYSNLGYTLLGAVIEKVAGLPYHEYIYRTICEPLGLDFYWDYTKINPEEVAKGYSLKEGVLEKEPLLGNGIYGAMGGAWASIHSFSKYIAFHSQAWPPRDEEDRGPVKRSTLREMHQPWKFIRLEERFKYSSNEECALMVACGYGLKSLKDSCGRFFVGHRGGLPGYGSNWYFMPDYGLGIVSLANQTYADMTQLDLNALTTLIHKAELKPRKLIPSSALQKKKDQLMALLPYWETIPKGVFADNFFLDRSLESVKRETMSSFKEAGNILSITEIVPENQLRGFFLLQGEKSDLRIEITLTPENPPLIQEFRIKALSRERALDQNG